MLFCNDFGRVNAAALCPRCSLQRDVAEGAYATVEDGAAI